MSLRFVVALSLRWLCLGICLAIVDETTSWQLVATVAAEEKVAEPTEAEAEPAVEKPSPAELTVEQLAERARKSVVVITVAGRDGKQQGLGSGFIIQPDGLIATNLHVIGEARPISVQTADGKKFEVKTVHASDRSLDLALIRIDAQDLPVLEMGDSDELKDGQAVIAMGNPHGLRHSVVSGVVSGKREIDGRQMIQLAIPIEPGNSGGPLLDMLGRVHGVLTMKSLVTNNLGFAVTVNSLKPLLKKPNPVPMSRWLTIGTLDPTEWTPKFGARWRQRSGHILVGGQGDGFGGRSLCLSELEVPEAPYEVAVTVKLDDEAGAAGLAFASDGGDKHYGFYPSGGKLRLTRFEGSDVYSWSILSNEASPHYRPGEWNTLKVRVEKDKLLCYVNDHLHLESKDAGLRGGKVGLAKFRQTEAEFKAFQLGKEVPPSQVPPEVADRLTKLVAKIPTEAEARDELIDGLLPDASSSMSVLRERARDLEEQAEQLKKLAKMVHQRQVQAELTKVMHRPEAEIELFRAGLLIAWLDNDELDVDAYLKQLDRLARELADEVPADADDAAKLAALNKYLFQELGFHGSRLDYYNRANSYLNEVLDDREGLPITLSVLYIELAGRLGVKVVGVGLPGHFVVSHVPAEGEPQLIDVYDDGKPLSREEADKLVRGSAGRPLVDEDLEPTTKQAIVVRMLHNLRGIATQGRDTDAMLRYLDLALAVAPQMAEDRSLRAVLRAQTGNRSGAVTDIDWLLEHRPDGVDLQRVREFKQLLERGDL